MSTGGGAGRGGTALSASPGRSPRGVAFAPAVRGFPGGIADMTSDGGELASGEPFGDDNLWAIPADAETGDAPDAAEDAPDQGRPGGPLAVQPAQAQPRQAQPKPAGPVSVWQQSAAAWQDAGIDWLRPANAEAGSAGAAGTRARPESTLAADDDPHTEPIPAISADVPPGAGGRSKAVADAGTAGPDPAAPGGAAGVPGAGRGNGTAADATVNGTADRKSVV